MKCREDVEVAAEAHSDLNIFGGVIALLEGGTVYTNGGQRTARGIIRLCKAEVCRQLVTYDKHAAKARRLGR